MTNFSNQSEEITLPDQPGVIEQPGQPDPAQMPGQPNEIQPPSEPDEVGLPGRSAAGTLSHEAERVVETAKAVVTAPLPHPPDLSGHQSSAKDLLSRLQWGEPALTIIDTRSREAFNNERITGAVPLPLGQGTAAVEPVLEFSRDIYIYGDGGAQAAEAAAELRQTGFENVAEIQGGLQAWKDVGGPTEGVHAFSSPVGSA